MDAQKNNLSIPGAIIAAGIIIALGIYFSRATPATNNKPIAPESAQISLKAVSADEHILGNPNAAIVLVEFSDTECPFCKNFQTTMQTIMNTYGKSGQVAWVYRQFPLDSIHPKTRKEAEATECANELGGNTMFWKYIDQVFTITTSNNTLDPQNLPVIAKSAGLDVAKFNACLASGKYATKVEAQFQDGLTAGAQGTPYSVLVLKTAASTDTVNTLNDYIASNGLAANVWFSKDNTKVAVSGALPIDMMTKIIDTLLK